MTDTPNRLEPYAPLPRTPTVRLPIRTGDVRAGLAPKHVIDLETRYGNSDMIRLLAALGVAGPFKVLSPWELEDETGRHLISAGGYAAAPFGEMYPPLASFVRDYVDISRSLGLPQGSAADWRAALEANLVALLTAHAPSHQDSRVFFSNSGAEAVEAALKFVRAARPERRFIINFTGAYHGKTYGALALTPNAEFQVPFGPLLDGVITVPYGDAQALYDTARRLGPERIAGIVLEPIQGEAGVVRPPDGFLPAVERLASKYGILTVADEIQTGLGRAGSWFASLAGGLEPDIITLAKPLGGGMVPVGATIARREVVQRALGGLNSKRHSNTFGGGSLAMAVGLRSLELIADENLVERARVLGERGYLRLQEIQRANPRVLAEVRGAGLLFALRFRTVVSPRFTPRQPALASQLGGGISFRALHQHGVQACFSLNAFHIIRLTPALTIPETLFGAMLGRLETMASAQPRAHGMLRKTPPGVLLRLAQLVSR